MGVVLLGGGGGTWGPLMKTPRRRLLPLPLKTALWAQRALNIKPQRQGELPDSAWPFFLAARADSTSRMC